MITPRTTRLVRVPDLQAFRRALVGLATSGPPLEARDRLLVVPTRAAAAQLVRTIESTALHDSRPAVVLPDFATADELVFRLAERLDARQAVLRDTEREALAMVACRAARDAGYEPPFRLRPGLVAEALRFYDALGRYQKDMDTFERLALGLLEPGAADDRGAERLVRQTRFLAAAFRELEQRQAGAGADEHVLRARLVAAPAPRPYRHVVVAVGDRSSDRYGLWPADWDLLSRLPALARLDVVVTDTALAGDLHERLHHLLPGLDEVREGDAGESVAPSLQVPAGDAPVHVARDREEEVAGFARRVKAAVRRGALDRLDRAALVVRTPLPYVYVTREVLRSAGVPCQMFDALPLAAESWAAAFDLACSAVGTGFARGPAVALLGSPHFRFEEEGERLTPAEVAALDRALAEHGYLGQLSALRPLVESWTARAASTFAKATADKSRSRLAAAARAGRVLERMAAELEPLRSPAPVADHLRLVLAFLAGHEAAPGPDDPLRARQLRARAALLGTLTALRDAYARFDSTPVEFDDTAAVCRRWIEAQTFSPRTGEAGVHLLDSASARFGEFDEVQLAGLVEGEWPDPSRRSIFYSNSVLRELGWPSETMRLDGVRAEFADLLRLPRQRLTVSTFALESDALVSASSLLDEIRRANLDAMEEAPLAGRVFEHEALGLEPADVRALDAEARAWAALRLAARDQAEPRFRGATDGHHARVYSLTSLERYLDCPFKFFAADVLRAEEPPDDQSAPSPRARGRFVHDVLQRFFAAWDQTGIGPITAETIERAREVAVTVAEPLLEALGDADAAIERARLFGTAISTGLVDIVLAHEVERPAEPVVERWLEHRFDGAFAIGPGGAPVGLNGVADRVDLLPGRRLRVIDYKSGGEPDVKRALQVPVYAMCAQESLRGRDRQPWTVHEAAYVALGSAKRTLVPVVNAADAAEKGEATLGEARARLHEVLDGIARGEFPAKPYEPRWCRYCAYSSICRKDYVDDD
ncbi:MAG TPA: PD-(D/E)XK nuclease family protein [Vicinamibacterales bacterium]|nr:PD-(D/E)XK nuclease family protein [Vicinamibacterales bacterium]